MNTTRTEHFVSFNVVSTMPIIVPRTETHLIKHILK